MDEQRKYAILFAATILAAWKLNEGGSTPWAIHVVITDAIQKAKHILEKIDERWPTQGNYVVPRSANNSATRSASDAPIPRPDHDSA